MAYDVRLFLGSLSSSSSNLFIEQTCTKRSFDSSLKITPQSSQKCILNDFKLEKAGKHKKSLSIYTLASLDALKSKNRCVKFKR